MHLLVLSLFIAVEVQSAFVGLRRLISGRASGSPQTECSICMELLNQTNASNPAVQLACGHKFHWLCIDDWKRTGWNCPICRRALDSETRGTPYQSVKFASHTTIVRDGAMGIP
eukprot:237351_1